MNTGKQNSSLNPGELLREELKAKKIKQIDFAATIGMPSSVLNDIVNGKRNITPDIAVLLETAVGIDASTWLKIQAERDIEIARAKAPLIQKQKDIETWQAIQDCCNTSYINRALPGGIGKTLAEKIENVLKFFHATDAKSLKKLFIEDVNPAFFRKSQKLAYVATDLFTWKQIAYNRSTDDIQDCRAHFKVEFQEDLLQDLLTILYENTDTINRISDTLRQYGIKFQIIANEKGTHIDGFSFWQGKNPTITLTLRYQRIDILAFTLFHELGHLFKHFNNLDAGDNYITLTEKEDCIEEQEADDFASSALIPSNKWSIFKVRNEDVSPYAITNKIIDFARENRIHPAIVLGRYQHDTKIYDNGKGIDRKIN